MEPSNFASLRVFLSFGPFFRPYRRKILRWFMVYGAYFIAGILTPYALKVYIDDVIHAGAGPGLRLGALHVGLPADPLARVWLFCAVYLAYALALQILNFFGNLGTARIIEDVVAELRATVFEKLHRVHLRFFDRTLSGEIVNQVTSDTRQLLNLVGGDLVNVALSSCMGLSSLVILCFWNLRLAAIVLAFLPAYAWLFYRYLPLVHRAARLWRRAEDHLWGNWGEKIKGMSVIQAFSRERSEALKHYSFGHRASDTWYRMTMFGVSMGNWGGFAAGLSSHAAYTVGCLLVYDGQLSLGELVTLYMFINFILAPVQGAFNLVNTWQQSSVSARRIQDLLGEVEEDPERGRKRRVSRLSGRIDLEELSFHYDPGQPVLKGLNLSVEPGQTVAL
ncbi:MAG TPA: ABC transporter ATP-binding protein, partial [bacterium]|nr:ABC transporter ATP-binding protein [bacterium]